MADYLAGKDGDKKDGDKQGGDKDKKEGTTNGHKEQLAAIAELKKLMVCAAVAIRCADIRTLSLAIRKPSRLRSTRPGRQQKSAVLAKRS